MLTTFFFSLKHNFKINLISANSHKHWLKPVKEHIEDKSSFASLAELHIHLHAYIA